MARRPKRSLADELSRHEQCVVAARTLTAALAGLYPDIAELRTAEMCLNLAHQDFQRRQAQPATEE
jgi:hypothetical protein